MTEPELSIIIASINGRPYIDACLEALARQRGAERAEVVVADCVGPQVADFVRDAYPDFRLIAFDEPKSVPELRSAGILASRGGIVAITEDHCIPPQGWYEAMVEAHQRRSEPAIGGAVDNAATDRIVDWAVYFCEYSNFISPIPEGVVHDLPGPNVSYKRAALDTMRDLIEDGYWETFLHIRLEETGQHLWSDPSVQVLHKKHYRFGEFLSERFHYGRAYAGTRNEFTPLSKRLVHLVGSPLLPPVLMVRIWRRVWSRKRHRSEFFRALPAIATFMLAWAAGEWVGYAFGAGDSELRLA